MICNPVHRPFSAEVWPMFTLPLMALSMLSNLELRCDASGCRLVTAEKPPLVRLHPIEVPTEVRPWTPKKPPTTTTQVNK